MAALIENIRRHQAAVLHYQTAIERQPAVAEHAVVVAIGPRLPYPEGNFVAVGKGGGLCRRTLWLQEVP